MASWPENPRLIGTRIPRLDGMAKASGQGQVSLRRPARGDAFRRDAL